MRQRLFSVIFCAAAMYAALLYAEPGDGETQMAKTEAAHALCGTPEPNGDIPQKHYADLLQHLNCRQ